MSLDTERRLLLACVLLQLILVVINKKTSFKTYSFQSMCQPISILEHWCVSCEIYYFSPFAIYLPSFPVVFFLPHYTAKRDGTRTPDSEAQGRHNHWIVRDFPSMVSFLIIQYVYLHPTFSFLSMSSPTFFFFF